MFFTIFWDFNIQCRVCYTACSVNRRETVSLFKFPIKSLMIPFELNWPVSLITIYILYVIITMLWPQHTVMFMTTTKLSWKNMSLPCCVLGRADNCPWCNSNSAVSLCFWPVSHLIFLILNRNVRAYQLVKLVLAPVWPLIKRSHTGRKKRLQMQPFSCSHSPDNHFPPVSAYLVLSSPQLYILYV